MKRSEIEAFVKDPLRQENAATAARLYGDETAWPAFERAFYAGAEAELTAEERATVARFVRTHCAPRTADPLAAALKAFIAERQLRLADTAEDYARAAAPASAARLQTNEPSHTPSAAEDVSFVFVSATPDDATTAHPAWRAELTLPAQAEPDDALTIRLTEAGGEPVPSGLFTIAGVTLPVADGRAELPYGLFLAGMRDTNVKLKDSHGAVSHGVLALFQ